MDVLNLTETELDSYRLGHRARAELRRVALAARREQAWIAARAGAQRLKAEFGATRVMAFGSLADGAGFHQRSDIDLAAWGMAGETYLQALAMLLNLDPRFSVDLVRAEEAPSSLLDHIADQGVAL